ncbi:MAG: zinc ribbon domain-containing protein [Burkholderiaceae bacterium]|nr:zinc ribbon domain-containing protein [Burkholderiaceae bacterium]
MPIYAYKCETCGHAKDVLQKMSDPLLTDCPACGNATFTKQLTAAGFQLKGTGWYVTDFREGAGKNSAPPTEAKAESGDSSTGTANSSPSESKNAESATVAASAVAKTESISKSASAVPSAPSMSKSAPSSND